MALVFGSLGLLVALAALYMVADVGKKAEAQVKHVINTHIRGMRDSLDNLTADITRISKRVANAEKAGGDLTKHRSELSREIAELERQLRQLRGDVNSRKEDAA